MSGLTRERARSSLVAVSVPTYGDGGRPVETPSSSGRRRRATPQELHDWRVAWGKAFGRRVADDYKAKVGSA